MNNIKVLDCTLRDGGYCNEWKFGFENIKKIAKGLLEANIDIVECGFITNKCEYNVNRTKFTCLDEIVNIIPDNREGKLFVAMMNYGEYNIDDLPFHNDLSIDGIRVAFHKKDIIGAMELCQKIKEKGYLVFVQAMVSLCYSDDEFLNLIKMSNDLSPYAFYIVDSFGMMKGKDLTRLFYVVEHNLDEDIWIGFHSHNNMQLAYSNAQKLLTVQTHRNLIIDTSIYGMGRGAGNLNTELFVEFLNENAGKKYSIKSLLNIIDEILNEFYQQNYWGYSLPNYISAVHNAHPNYANYLDDKKTLTIGDINDIFDMMDDEKKVSFDKDYVEFLYLKHMTMGKVQEEHKSELNDILLSRKVILIAPGKSSIEEKDKLISAYTEGEFVVISINFEYEQVKTDYIFLSNLRRFRELDNEKRTKCIVTSNIPADGVYYQAKYSELLNSEESVRDNAGLMAIKFLIMHGVSAIYLAGFDGYSHDKAENYSNSDLEFFTRNAVLDAMNYGLTKMLKKFSGDVDLFFLTEPRYILI